MLFSSCQKWFWNWFWISINFTLCSLWEVFHLLKFESTVLFKDMRAQHLESLSWPRKLRCSTWQKNKNHSLITMDFVEISEESLIQMQFQGLPPSFSSRKCSTKACIFWEGGLIGPGWHCFSVWPTAAA